MKLLYFAWVRTRIGMAAEEIIPPDTVVNVGLLIEWLRARGAGYAHAFADLNVVRVAVNQEYAGLGHALKPGDEIAFFPPVTGG